MRKRLTDAGVRALKPRAQRYAFPDPQLVGHYVRVQPSGVKSFVAVARSPAGKQVWSTIGAADVMKIGEAREKAREAIKRVRAGEPAFEALPDSFAAVADMWIKRYAEPRGLRSLTDIRQMLVNHVLPAWGDRPFTSIRRSDIAALLDQVEDRSGARSADRVLTTIRGIANWYAARNDDYQPPFVRGMRRQDPKEHVRSRTLSDDEIRTVWKVAEADGKFGSFVRLALLTAQRRDKIATMRWANIALDGVWTIPSEAREKGNGESLKLPEMALDIIKAQPRIVDNPYVFAASRGNRHSNGLDHAKTRFDAKLDGVAHFTIHDLRRTSRSLMSRAGVPDNVSERIMGHAPPHIESIYNRHRYDAEKADALARLAALIDGIVHPRENVVPMEKKRERS